MDSASNHYTPRYSRSPANSSAGRRNNNQGHSVVYSGHLPANNNSNHDYIPRNSTGYNQNKTSGNQQKRKIRGYVLLAALVIGGAAAYVVTKPEISPPKVSYEEEHAFSDFLAATEVDPNSNSDEIINEIKNEYIKKYDEPYYKNYMGRNTFCAYVDCLIDEEFIKAYVKAYPNEDPAFLKSISALPYDDKLSDDELGFNLKKSAILDLPKSDESISNPFRELVDSVRNNLSTLTPAKKTAMVDTFRDIIDYMDFQNSPEALSFSIQKEKEILRVLKMPDEERKNEVENLQKKIETNEDYMGRLDRIVDLSIKHPDAAAPTERYEDLYNARCLAYGSSKILTGHYGDMLKNIEFSTSVYQDSMRNISSGNLSDFEKSRITSKDTNPVSLSELKKYMEFKNDLYSDILEEEALYSKGSKDGKNFLIGTHEQNLTTLTSLSDEYRKLVKDGGFKAIFANYERLLVSEPVVKNDRSVNVSTSR